MKISIKSLICKVLFILGIKKYKLNRDNIEILTKQEAYQKFIKDLREIENNLTYANKGEFIKLKEYYKLVDIDDDELTNLLKSTGFNSLDDFFNQRDELKKQDSHKIRFFKSAIIGINNAVEKRLKDDLKQNPT